MKVAAFLLCGCILASLSFAASMSGAPSPVDSNDASVEEAAQFALNTINAQSNSITPFELIDVLYATEQLVNGVNYQLVLALKRNEDNYEAHQVTVYQDFNGEQREMSDHVIPDKVSKTDFSHTFLTEAATAYSNHEAMNAGFEFQNQVESGWIQTFQLGNPQVTLKVTGLTDSLYMVTGHPPETTKTPSNQAYPFLFAQTDDGAISFVETSMEHSTAFESTPESPQSGAPTPADSNDAEIQEVAAFALNMINMQSNSMTPFKLLNILYSTQQVVNGVNYHLVLALELDEGNYEAHQVTVYQNFNGENREMSAHSIPEKVQTDFDEAFLSAAAAAYTNHEAMNAGFEFQSEVESGWVQTFQLGNPQVTLKVTGLTDSLYMVTGHPPETTKTPSNQAYPFLFAQTDDEDIKFIDTSMEHSTAFESPRRPVGAPSVVTDDPDLQRAIDLAMGYINSDGNEYDPVRILFSSKQLVNGYNWHLVLLLKEDAAFSVHDVVLYTTFEWVPSLTSHDVPEVVDLAGHGPEGLTQAIATQLSAEMNVELSVLTPSSLWAQEVRITAFSEPISLSVYGCKANVRQQPSGSLSTSPVEFIVFQNGENARFELIAQSATVTFSNQPLIGGPVTVNANDAELLRIASEAVATLNAKTGAKYVFAQMLSARVQLVNGKNYYFTLILKDTSAPNAATTMHELTVYMTFSGDMSLSAHTTPSVDAAATLPAGVLPAAATAVPMNGATVRLTDVTATWVQHSGSASVYGFRATAHYTENGVEKSEPASFTVSQASASSPFKLVESSLSPLVPAVEVLDTDSEDMASTRDVTTALIVVAAFSGVAVVAVLAVFHLLRRSDVSSHTHLPEHSV